jgi:hypothetical protein
VSTRAARAWRLPPAERLLGRPTVVALVCAAILLVAGTLLSPEPATALPLPSPADLLPGGVNLPSLDPTHWVVDGFKAILQFIFGDQLDQLGRHLVNLLLSIPLLTDNHAFPQLNNYRAYVTGGAWGILALSFVIASLRYWLSSYSGSGAYEALTGFVRSAGAIAMLLIFPVVFDQLSRAVNAFTSALVVNPVVGDGLGKGMVGTISDVPFSGGGIAMLIGIAAVVMAIILLVVKVIVTALLAVLFVASPLAIAIWPIEELSWAMRSLLQAIVGLLIFPVLWAVCFGTFAVLSTDAMFPADNGEAINTVLSPLIALAALIIAFRLPFAVLSQAMKAGISPGIGRGLGHVRNAGYVRSLTKVGGR